MPSPILASAFQLLTRLYPMERGKFKILSKIYFKWLAPRIPTLVQTSLSFGIKMRLDITEFLQAHLYLYGSYELPTVKFIRSVLRSGDTAFDIGAQIGYLTLAMATTKLNGIEVHSFEPETHNLERLRANIKLNPGVSVTVVEKAASDVNGMLRLYLSHDHNSGTHSTVAGGVNVSESFIEIPSISIDEYVKSNNISSIRLIKIDVEGGELEVIRGAEWTLTTLRPVIVMEMSDALQAARGFTTTEFKQLLAGMGYRSYVLSNSGKLIESSVNTGHLMENVVFIHDSSKMEFQSSLSA